MLRGPQGIPYGRNMIGGTISMRHTRPTGELGATLHGHYCSYNTCDLDAVVSLPKIGDIASVKLFGHLRKSDSFNRNRYPADPGRARRRPAAVRRRARLAQQGRWPAAGGSEG